MIFFGLASFLLVPGLIGVIVWVVWQDVMQSRATHSSNEMQLMQYQSDQEVKESNVLRPISFWLKDDGLV